jgi:hypothetical protein
MIPQKEACHTRNAAADVFQQVQQGKQNKSLH